MAKHEERVRALYLDPDRSCDAEFRDSPKLEATTRTPCQELREFLKKADTQDRENETEVGDNAHNCGLQTNGGGNSQGNDALQASTDQRIKVMSILVNTGTIETPKEIDSRHKVHKTQDFKPGRIFKILWSEPRGKQVSLEGSRAVEATIFGHESYQEIRRFVIINLERGRCTCLPITKYPGRGVLKQGINAKVHEVIYSSDAKTSRGYNGSQTGPKSNKWQTRRNEKSDEKMGEGQQCIAMEIEHTKVDQEHLELQENEHGQWQMCETCGGYQDQNHAKWRQIQGHVIVSRSLTALAVLGLGSGLAVGASFLWLNKSMELNETSPTMNWIMQKALVSLPRMILQPLAETPDGIRFSTFVIATAVFTGTSFIWAATKSGAAARALAWALILMLLVGWIMAGVTVDELLLVCLPPSVSLGLLLGSLFDKRGNAPVPIDEEKYCWIP